MKIRPDTRLRALDTARDSQDGMSARLPPHRYWRSISFTHVPLDPWPVSPPLVQAEQLPRPKGW